MSVRARSFYACDRRAGADLSLLQRGLATAERPVAQLLRSAPDSAWNGELQAAGSVVEAHRNELLQMQVFETFLRVTKERSANSASAPFLGTIFCQ